MVAINRFKKTSESWFFLCLIFNGNLFQTKTHKAVNILLKAIFGAYFLNSFRFFKNL